LDAIATVTGRAEFSDAANRYYTYYLENYLEPDGLPKLTPTNPFPVNIHACAEALLLNARMSTRRPEALLALKRTAAWTLSNMATDDGWFGWLRVGNDRRSRLVRIPMMRWGQAWMLRGLVAAHEAMDQDAGHGVREHERF
jgi:hypothetical protein